MVRRAQTIGIKDSGFLISWLGIGVGSRVLEGGHEKELEDLLVY